MDGNYYVLGVPERLGLEDTGGMVRVGQVHLFYRARMLSADLDPGPETIEAGCSASTRCPGTRSRFVPCAKR